MTAVLLYIGTVLIWGTTWLGMKFQVGVVAPEVSVAYRFAAAALIMLVWCLVRGTPLRFSLKAHAYMAGLGVFIFSTNFLLFYIAAESLTTGLNAVIFCTTVVMNIVNGALFFRTPIEGRVVLAAGIGLAGMAIVFWPELNAFSLQNAESIAVLLALGGSYCFSLGNMVSTKIQNEKLPLIPTTAYAMAYGAAFMALLATLRGSPFTFDPQAPYVLSLLYLTIFGSVVAFLCYLGLLGRIGASRASYATVLFPVIALGLSALFEDFELTPMILIGVALILLGNILVLSRNKKSSNKPQPPALEKEAAQP